MKLLSYTRVLILCLFIIPLFSFAQNSHQADSLQYLISNSEGVDKVELLIKIALLNTKDSAHANEYINKALSLAKESNNANLIGKSYMSLGFVAQDNFNYSLCDTYFLKADSVYKSINDNIGRGLAHKNIGRSFLEQAYFDKSIVHFKLSYDFLKKTQDTLQTYYALYAIGYGHYGLKNYDSAFHYFFKVMPYCELNDKNSVCSDMYNQLGTTYSEINEPKKAMQYLEMAYESYINNQDSTKAANSLINMAGIYFFKNNMDSCLYFLNKSIELHNKTKNLKGELIGTNNMAAIHKEIGQLEKSSKYILRAIDLAKKLKDRGNLTISYINLFDLNRIEKKYSLADLYADSAFLLASKIKSKYLLEQYYKHITQLRREQKRYDEAFNMYDLQSSYKDSLLNESKTKQIAELETKFESEKKDKQLLLNKIILSENKELLQKQIGVIIFLIMVVLIISFWYYNRRKRQSLHHQMTINKERSRIAMDLHDHLGAELTIINSKLDTSAYKSNTNSEKAALTTISNQVRQAGKTLRETVWSIQNEAVTIDELIQRIETFGQQLLDGTNTKLTITTNSTHLQLSPQHALDVFRVLQEALTNVFKYAQASNINLSLTINTDTLSISISDNGIGFNVENEPSGFGLKNMKTRVEKMGSKLELSSSENKGTTIAFKIDLT